MKYLKSFIVLLVVMLFMFTLSTAKAQGTPERWDFSGGEVKHYPASDDYVAPVEVFEVEDPKWEVLVLGFSYHLDDRTYYDEKKDEAVKYNESHNTLGVGYDDWYVVYSKLSYYNHSLSVFKKLKWSLEEFGINANVATRLGIIYGYGGTPFDYPVLPMASPGIEFKLYKNVHLDLYTLAPFQNVVMVNARIVF